ncbi:MAG: putative transposase [Thermoanaerobacterium sp.]|jgi:hypothetical protein|nr:putative transposase [Thermoanaerobacterium sp.]
MIGKEVTKEPERKSFAYDTVNILWQGDMSVGPYLIVDGKKLRTYLFAFIDDCLCKELHKCRIIIKFGGTLTTPKPLPNLLSTAFSIICNHKKVW